MTITTNDCRDFLVAEVTKDPSIITHIFVDDVDNFAALDDALIAKNWIRETKFNPSGEHDYADELYHTWTEGKVYDADELSVIRLFALKPERYEDSVIYAVLEDKQGRLILGDYYGD